MIGEEIPNVLYIFLVIYAIILLAVAIFIQLYFARKGTNIVLNIFCIFLWFTMLLVILIFPLDLFSNFLFENNSDNATKMKILSASLYWNFYVCGFLIVDQIKGYITNGNFNRYAYVYCIFNVSWLLIR